jgi:TetR/AcrR family transcriptional regulator, repressor for uid operon
MKSVSTLPGRLAAPAAGSSHDRILQAAKHLFAAKGYDNTSTAAIARLAGTSESQLIKHFSSKEGLLEAIFEQSWQKLTWPLKQAMQQAPTPLEKLKVLLDLVIGAFERDAELKQLLLLEGRHIRKDGHMILLTQGFVDLVATLDGLLAEMRKSGQMRADLHAEGVRSALIGAIEGMLRDQIVAKRIRFPAHYNVKDIREIFSVFLASILVPDAAQQ